MKKINIMYLYSSKGFGGIVQNLSLLANNLDIESFNVIVVSLTNKSDEGSDIHLKEKSRAIFHRIDETGKLDLRSLFEIKELITRYRIDILSCHGYKADLCGLLLSKFYRCNVRLVAMAHGWVTPGLKFRIYYLLDKLILRYFDRIILVADGLLDELKGFAISPDKTVVIHNAIDTDVLEKKGDRNALRKVLNLGREDLVIGFIGRLSKEKSIDTVLFAVKKTLVSLKDVKFLIVGEGSQKDSLLNIAEKLGINDRIIFAGYQKEVEGIYGVLDLYVSASLKEGLPNSILEAQAMGVPCIVTDISGNNDIIKNGVNGYLIKPGDHETLSRKIVALLEDKDLAGRFTVEGKRIVKQKFSLTERIGKLEDLYRELMASIGVKS
ncbi:MAG: glycosyltransferase [Candidatus Omnitrophica bacterium]|nr:glycosyltransferase [Candidatus Omnitrophota bacterium]